MPILFFRLDQKSIMASALKGVQVQCCCRFSFFQRNNASFSNHFRFVSTSTVNYGKRNFRKFQAFNKRGLREFKDGRKNNPMYDLGVRPTGFSENGIFHKVPEMVPELIVPDLEGFALKPYVSYRVPDVVQSQFTAKDLFDACYTDKIVQDFKDKQLAEDGSALNPSPQEKLTADEARIRALQTGSDRF